MAAPSQNRIKIFEKILVFLDRNHKIRTDEISSRLALELGYGKESVLGIFKLMQEAQYIILNEKTAELTETGQVRVNELLKHNYSDQKITLEGWVSE